MKRVRDVLNKERSQSFIEALSRRKEYYLHKFRPRETREIIEEYLESAECKKLHLGSGSNQLEGWLNSDILGIKPGMAFIDVRERLPFKSNTFDFVYSEHLLEHLGCDEGFNLMRECFRILEWGGILRISTPDLSFLVKFYTHNTRENEEYLKWASDFYWNLTPYSKAMVINNYFRSWGHKFIYDYELLRVMCQKVGFRHVTEEGVGRSSYPELRGIEKHGNAISNRWNIKESLIIEAEK